jgi:hypothetical protein
MDSLTLHASVALDGTVPVHGIAVRVAAERLHDGLYLVRATASSTAPPVARASGNAPHCAARAYTSTRIRPPLRSAPLPQC